MNTTMSHKAAATVMTLRSKLTSHQAIKYTSLIQSSSRCVVFQRSLERIRDATNCGLKQEVSQLVGSFK